MLVSGGMMVLVMMNLWCGLCLVVVLCRAWYVVVWSADESGQASLRRPSFAPVLVAYMRKKRPSRDYREC